MPVPKTRVSLWVSDKRLSESAPVALSRRSAPLWPQTQFLAPFAARKIDPANLITAAEEFNLELEQETTGESSEVISAFSAMKAFFTGLASPAKTEPAPPVVTPPAAAPDFATFSATIAEGFAKIGTVIEATTKANDERFTKLSGDLAALQTKLENTPSTTFTQRPVSPGGDARPRADC